MRIVRALHYHSEKLFIIIYDNSKINPTFESLLYTITKPQKAHKLF